MDTATPTTMKMRWYSSPAMLRAVIYIVAFVTGAIVMSFEMLGSRYLNPYFGSGIYTWAALISTVLAALTAGYFLGGFIADRTVSASVLGAIVGVASLYLLALPSFADVDTALCVRHRRRRAPRQPRRRACHHGSCRWRCSGVYSPFAIRLVLRATQHSGTVSGAVYGVSTAGSIAGTLGTTFFLIPGDRDARHNALAWCGRPLLRTLAVCARSRASAEKAVRSPAVLVAFAVLVLGGDRVWSDNLIDENVRAQMLKHSDGRVAHLETEYNNLFIDKHGSHAWAEQQV